MKSQLFAAFLFSVSLAQAQDTAISTVHSKTHHPFTLAQAGDWSTEATLLLQTGNASIRLSVQEIKCRKFIQDQFVLRTRLMAAQSKEVTIINQGSGLMERSITDFTALVAPGFEKHQHINNKHTYRLSPYWGFELPIGKHNYEYNLTNSRDGQNFYNGGTFNSKVTKAYSLGLNLLYGIDFYITKGMFIGTEIGYGFLREKYGMSNITTFDGTLKETRSIPMGSNNQLNLNFNTGLRFGIIF